MARKQYRDPHSRIRAMRADNAVAAAQAEVETSAMLARIYGADSAYGDRHARDRDFLAAMIARRERIKLARGEG